jgi:hypothetical protein
MVHEGPLVIPEWVDTMTVSQYIGSDGLSPFSIVLVDDTRQLKAAFYLNCDSLADTGGGHLLRSQRGARLTKGDKLILQT